MDPDSHPSHAQLSLSSKWKYSLEAMERFRTSRMKQRCQYQEYIPTNHTKHSSILHNKPLDKNTSSPLILLSLQEITKV